MPKHSLVPSFLSLALAISTTATPTPILPHSESLQTLSNGNANGLSIPLRKRTGLADSNGIFDADKAQIAVVMAKNKHRQNMINYLGSQGVLFNVSWLLGLPSDLSLMISSLGWIIGRRNPTPCYVV